MGRENEVEGLRFGKTTSVSGYKWFWFILHLMIILPFIFMTITLPETKICAPKDDGFQ